MEEKLNRLMEESEGCLLCYTVNQPVDSEGYKNRFLPLAQKIIAEYGELRFFVVYEEYKGWEEEAARMDVNTAMELGKYYGRMALINPPQSVVFQRKLKDSLYGGEYRIYTMDQFDEALAWVKADMPAKKG